MPPVIPPVQVVTEPPVDSVAIRQVLPSWNSTLFRSRFPPEFQGAIEVVIDEHGDVTEARIVTPIHPSYDPQLLEAAKTWKYQPARRNGKPIRSTKKVDVVLRPD